MRGKNRHERIDKELIEEQRRIEAAKAVLKRKGLDIADRLRTEDDLVRYQSVLALWQNEDFLTDLEKTISMELEPDPGGIRRFLMDFEAYVEDLDARWLLALWRQNSGQLVDFDSMSKEYQETYTNDLLRDLEGMGAISGVNSITQHRLALWKLAVANTLAEVTLDPHRAVLRQAFAKFSFHLDGRRHTASDITARVLREEPDRTRRLTVWQNLARLSQQVEPMMRELLVQTNALWQERGYTNAIAPRLQTIGVSEDVVRQIIVSCEKASRSASQKLINTYEEFLGHEVMQWDWRFAAGQLVRPFEQSFEKTDTITCIKQTYEQMGVMIDQLPIRIMESSVTYGTNRHFVRIP
ncbi:MAG: hypothetical protein ACXADX_15355, partial [Candidatus Hodarchaeales archaeon]